MFDPSKLSEINIAGLPLSALLGALLTFLICVIVINVIMKLVAKALGGAKRGIPTASLVALLSVAGLALSLSVQGVLGNIFAGLTLLMTHPFAEGNFVEVAGKTGTVKSISLLYTTIDTLDNVEISIPNSDVIGSSVTNYSAEPMRRVDMTFSASYDEPTEKVKAAIMEVIRADSRIVDSPAPFVALNAYNESTVEYVVRVWVKNADYWDVHFMLNEQVRESFARNGVKMSYPHMNVHVVEK